MSDSEPQAKGRTPRSRRTIERILKAAGRRFGRAGFSGASMTDVAKEAGVSKGLLHYHFRSKEELLIEAQRAAFRQLHKRFMERALRGERGLDSALDGLDSMWGSVRDLRAGAPFIVETLAITGHEGPVPDRLADFYQESTALLEDGIRRMFQDRVDELAVPPERMAVIIRVLLEGLVVELARARGAEDLAQVDQAYSDMRELFRRFVLSPDSARFEMTDLETLALPW